MKYLMLLIALSFCKISFGQFVSSFHEDQLLYDHNIVMESEFLVRKSEQPKRLTWVLPNFSATMVSPQLTYGDIYVEESKTLDLTLATQSGDDFDLQMNARVSYGGLSYRINNIRFSLFHDAIVDTRMNIPNHLFELVTEGNSRLVSGDIDINPQVLFSSTHKWALGFDYQKENLVLGVQANMYTGNAFLNTYNSTLNIDFGENFFEFGFDKDILVESSGAINFNTIDSVDLILKENALTTLGSFSNIGFGLSAQFSYTFNDNLRIFGRVDDIGIIRWTNETQILDEQSSESFGGFDIRESYISGQTFSIEDTLYSKLDIAHSSASFTSTLQNSFFIGANYIINDYFSAGILLRSKNNGVNQVFFLEPYITLNPFEKTSITVANFMQKSSPINPKLTLRTELGETFGINLSLVNPWRVSRYYDTKMIHASLGMYLRFLKE